jgi:cohesin complex subunit SA-1/2
VSVGDLLVCFSKRLKDNPHLKPLVYEPDRDLQQILENFIQTYVFVEEEEEDVDEEGDEHKKN